MPKTRLKNRPAVARSLYWLIRGIVFALACLPRTVHGLVTAGLCRLAYRYARSSVDQVRANTHHVLGMDATASNRFARAHVCHQINCSLESLEALYSRRRITVDGFDAFQATMDAQQRADRGVIIIAAHLGAWELSARYIAATSRPQTYVLGRSPSALTGQRLLDDLRSRANTRVIWSDQPRALRAICSAFEQGATLGFVMDQKPPCRQGITVPFLEQPTCFVSGPARFAIRYNYPVISLSCIRVAPFHFQLVHKLVLPRDHGKQCESELTGLFARELESQIRRFPEQWAWSYRRWHFRAPIPAKA